MKTRKKYSPIWTMERDAFILLVTTASSTTEMLAAFGLQNKGGNSRTLWNRIRFEGIDETSIKQNGRRNSLNALAKANTIYSNTEVFCVNSTYSRAALKKRVINQKLITYTCSICGQEPWWNGKPMILILDHINGIHNDNRLENLRFVCGNCNTQLDTNGAKNKRRFS